MILEPLAKAKVSTTLFAPEGNAAHDLLEQCIIQDRSPESFLGEKFTVEDDSMDFPIAFTVDNEMADAVQMVLDHVNHGKEDGNVYPELNLIHSEVPELTGTSDYVRVNGSHGVIKDFKYGKAQVQARYRNGKLNSQLMCYSSLVFDKFPDLETAEIGIIQPRSKTKKKTRETEITRDDVDEFMLTVKASAAKINAMLDKEMPLAPTEGDCWYCKANRICPTKIRKQIDRDFA